MNCNLKTDLLSFLPFDVFLYSFLFFTARICSMTGRYCFHRCLSVNISGGGYPIQIWMIGGFPHPSLARGVPHPRSGQGGTPSQVWPGGVPHPRPGMGYLPARPGMGYPPDLGWGTPLDMGQGTPPDLGWGTPPDMGQGTGTPRYGTGYPPRP